MRKKLSALAGALLLWSADGRAQSPTPANQALRPLPLSEANALAQAGRSVSPLKALRLEITDVRRQMRDDVVERHDRVLGPQRRAETEAQALELFEDTAAAVQRRRAAGEELATQTS